MKSVQVSICVLAVLPLAGCEPLGNGAPTTGLPTIVIEAHYPGAGAAVVADTVAAVIEIQVSGVENSLRLLSHCTNDGKYTLVAMFKQGTDLDTALVLVQNRVALALPVLPAEVVRGGVTVKKKASLGMMVTLSAPAGRYDALYLSNYATVYIKDELARLPGVGEVVDFGRQEEKLASGSTRRNWRRINSLPPTSTRLLRKRKSPCLKR